MLWILDRLPKNLCMQLTCYYKILQPYDLCSLVFVLRDSSLSFIVQKTISIRRCLIHGSCLMRQATIYITRGYMELFIALR